MANLCYGDLMERTAGAYPFSPEHLRRLKDVFRMAKNAAARCLIGPPAECNKKIIRAHSVQEAKLRLIADEHGNVYTLSPDVMKTITRKGDEKYTMEDEFLQYRSINNSLMTGKWACAYHDNKVFSAIEKDAIDPDNEEHCLLLSHRATTVDYFAKHVMRKFFMELAWEFPNDHSSLDILIHTGRLELVMNFHMKIKQALEDLRNGENSTIEHRHILIHNHPRIASTLLTTRGGDIISTPREIEAINKMNVLVPPMEIPMIVTVYPEIDKSVAVLSFPKAWQGFVRVIMPAFWENDESISSALLSKTLLEETDNIMISPVAWHAFSERKKRRILSQFSVTSPQHMLVPSDDEGTEMLSEEAISSRMYERDPDFIDHSDPKELDLFEN